MKNNKRVWKLFILVSIFTLVLTVSLTLGFSVFAAEEETAEATQEVTKTTEKFIDWVKNLDMSAIKGYAAGIIAYLSGNLLLILGLAIKLVLGKTQQIKNEKFYQDLMAKMDAEHKKQMEEQAASFENKLESISNAITDELKRQNSEKRINAKESVEQMRKHLDDINIELDK